MVYVYNIYTHVHVYITYIIYTHIYVYIIYTYIYIDCYIKTSWESSHKSTTDTDTRKKKESKHYTKHSHQNTREEKERGKGEKTSTQTNPNQLTKCYKNIHINSYLSVNGLYAPTKRSTGWMDIKTRHIYVFATYKRPTYI